MPFFVTKPLQIPLGCDVEDVTPKLLKLLRLKQSELKNVCLHRQSVDARNKSDVHFVCSYLVEATRAPQNAQPYVFPQDVLCEAKPRLRKEVVVVGAGPAGLFAALYLVKSGCNVTVVERGADIFARQAAVKEFFVGGKFNSETNVQFGLGGAGTFSDGKLTSGISSPLTYTVFRQFVRSGAPRSVITSATPHVGTDNLAAVVANLRDEIVSYGGRFLFNAAVTDFVANNGCVEGVRLANGSTLPAQAVVLACGHSARDIFDTLYRAGAEMTFKPFAVGLRIEHTRQFINQAQYGELFAAHRDLPSANYKLAFNGADRSCYSFCMCPGGTVVAANSEPNTVVVNGMSDHARNGANSNSALVVNVTAQDMETFGFGKGVFAGVEFQHALEREAFALGGGNYVAPCQNVADFAANRLSCSFDVAPSYPRGVASANMRNLLPEPLSNALCRALEYFDGKIRGFGSSGVFTGVESRTSSPVRIVRDASFQSNLRNLYPVGEGAGYAGGIVSSAVDGLRVAMSIADPVERNL